MMAIEIERKFQVVGGRWRGLVTSKEEIIQGYFLGGSKGLVRVRFADPRSATITFKGKSSGLSRTEIEFSIQTTQEDVTGLLGLCDGTIVKTRYRVPHHADPELTWEIDEFHSLNEGLLLAELEIPREDYVFETPDWIGEELSDSRYFNAGLIHRPYSTW